MTFKLNKYSVWNVILGICCSKNWQLFWFKNVYLWPNSPGDGQTVWRKVLPQCIVLLCMTSPKYTFPRADLFWRAELRRSWQRKLRNTICCSLFQWSQIGKYTTDDCPNRTAYNTVWSKVCHHCKIPFKEAKLVWQLCKYVWLVWPNMFSKAYLLTNNNWQ